MIIIEDSKNKQFRVVTTGDNNEKLSVTQNIETKANVKKNIRAQFTQWMKMNVEDRSRGKKITSQDIYQ